MRVHSSRRFTRSASLLTTAVLLWLGVFLFWWPASGSEVSTSFSMGDAPHVEHAANGDGYPIDGNYLAVFAQEDEAGNKLPKNAVLLRTLVFVLFFGPVLKWLVVSGWIRSRLEACSPIRCWFLSIVRLHQRRAVATLLGIFRL